MMFEHQRSTLARVSEHFSKDPEVTGLILAGSIAHGFCSVDSDVDVMIVVSDDCHAERLRTARGTFFSRELCTYDSYVDGKYISEGLLREVRAKGSEPARYAFKDAQVVFSTNPALPALLEEVARYPVEQKASRIRRFQAQVEAWRWYTSEAYKRQNLPLLRTAVAKLTLFGGRLILAHNELLYPYHKWFLRVLATAPDKPEGFLELIEQLASDPGPDAIERFAGMVRDYGSWDMSEGGWGAQFMQDSELNWLNAPPPIDDL